MNYTDLFSPSKLSILLSAHGIHPKKSLGQHFLIDKNNAEKIVAAVNLTKYDTVVEVGSGLGALTYPLGLYAGRVIAYEIDGRLIPVLKEIVRELWNVEAREEDILKFSIFNIQFSNYTVVGNLPYYITSRILRHFLSLKHKPKRIVVTVQKEVAERICAKPPNMSLLAVSAQLYGEPKIVARVSKNCFFPRPEVDSAILAFDIEAPRDVDENAFFALVKAGFAHKRKLLIRNLERGLSISKAYLCDAFSASSISKRARAEELGLEEWRLLNSKLKTQISKPQPKTFKPPKVLSFEM